MATVDTLQINIQASSTDANKALRKLLKTLNEFKKLDNADLNAISRGFNSLNASISSISAVNIRKVERLADALERLKKVRKVDATVSLTRTVNNAKEIVDEATPKVVPDTPAIQPGEEGSSSPEKVEQGVKKTTSAFEKLKKVAKQAGNIVAKSFLKMSESISDGIKMLGKFIKALARVAFYRFVRFILKTITDGLKEGTDNLVAYSRALGGLDAANASGTMDKLAKALLYVKNSVGAAAMPIIQTLTPALVNLAHTAINVINVFNQLISIFQGKNTFTRAKEYWIEYGGNIDKATGSAKALQKQLAGFDELNNLTTSQGGGGGSATPALDPTKMFEEAEIESKLYETAEKIKKMFEEIKELIPVIGAGILAWAISSKLANALTSLKLLSALNALKLVVGLTFMAAGFTLEGLNIADIIKNGINFENFGKVVGGALLASIGAFLTGSSAAALFDLAILTPIIGGIGTALAGAGMMIAGIWSSVVEGIDWLSSILTVLGAALTGTGIGAIVGAIVGALGGPIGAGMGALIGAAIGLVIGAITNLVISVVQNWDSIVSYLKGVWENVTSFAKEKWTNFKEDFIGAFEYIKNNLPNIISNITNKLKELPHDIAYQIGYIVGLVFANMVNLKDYLVTSVKELVEDLKEFIAYLPTLIKDTWTAIWDYIKSIPGAIWELLTLAFNKVKQWGADIMNWIKTEMPKIINAIGDWFSKLPDTLKIIGENMITGLWNGIISMGTWLVDCVKNFFGTAWETIKGAFTGFGEGVSAGYKSVPRYANGGIVKGDLFIANENGTEMIGNLGGNTAVANNDMITEAIANATYRAMTQALSENGMSVTIEGDTEKIFKVMRDKSRDFRRDTGRSAFA